MHHAPFRLLAAALLATATAACGPAPYLEEPETPEPPQQPAVAYYPVAPVAQVVAVQTAAPVVVVPASPAALVLSTLESYEPLLDRCYRKGLRKNHGLRGNVVVRMYVDGRGNVAHAMDHGSDLPNRKVIKCMLKVYRDVEFSPALAGSTVIHPRAYDPSAYPPSRKNRRHRRSGRGGPPATW
jgi:hypothetical protein